MKDSTKAVMESIRELDIDIKKVEYFVNLFEDKIKSICKRRDFPVELNYICTEFAKKSYLYYKNKDNSKNEQMQVSKASDNGQSVEFKLVENITKEEIDIDKVIAKNMSEISNYAYMEWK